MSNSLTSGARQVLMAAEPLFAAHGFDGVSIQQIASEAGVSKANVYHHFSSKDELYLTVLRYAFEDMTELLASLNSLDDSSKRQLSYFSNEHLNHLNEKPNITRLVLRELLDGGSSRGSDLAQKVFGEYFSRLRELLCRGQGNGDIRNDINPDHMAVALAGINVFLFQVWPAIQHFPGGLFQNQQVSGEIMFELLLNGLVPRGDE